MASQHYWLPVKDGYSATFHAVADTIRVHSFTITHEEIVDMAIDLRAILPVMNSLVVFDYRTMFGIV